MTPRDFHSAALERAKRGLVEADDVFQLLLAAMVVGGNVLIEGMPGTAKTLMARSLAQLLAGAPAEAAPDSSRPRRFQRIQFTPDLMPSDILGTNVFNGATARFSFRPGPIFASVVLADEINRAPAKTQSALLEAMEEGQVTIEGQRMPLPALFMVVATQNPVEFEGTYPLPEAQLDRFLFKTLVPFPGPEELIGIIGRTIRPPDELTAVVTGEQLLEMARVARAVPVASTVAEYAVRLLLATHPEREEAPAEVRRYVRAGASPRALQALITAGQVRALLEGRYNASVEDVQALALPVLRHRVLLNFEGQAEGLTSDAVVARLLDSVRV